MTPRFIAAQRTDYGVGHSVTCRALGVAESTFYEHRDRPLTSAQQRRASLDAEVAEVFWGSDGTYESARVRAQVRRRGRAVTKKTVEASMARQGLCARVPRKEALTSQNRSHIAARDLLGRDFGATQVNQKWCGNNKQVATGEGPVFLATVLDLHSRRMVAFRHGKKLPDHRASQKRDQHSGRRPRRNSPTRRIRTSPPHPQSHKPNSPRIGGNPTYRLLGQRVARVPSRCPKT